MNIFDNRFQAYLRVSGEITKFVYLREDENGRYIEYAFMAGFPHDNRCLSWYCKPHPRYAKRHNGAPAVTRNVGEIYRLTALDCGRSNKEYPEDRCTPGCPWKACTYPGKDWTYDEPVKCACWDLEKIDVDNMDFSLRSHQIDDYIRILAELNEKE